MLLSCPIVRNGMDVQNVLDALFLLTVADWPKESGSLFATGLHAAPRGNLATCCRIILASLSFRPRGEGCYGAYGVGGGEEGGVVWAVARLLVHVGTRTSVQLLRATGIRFKSFMCQGREVFAGVVVEWRGYRVVDTLSSSSGLNNETTNEIELNNEFRKLVRMPGRGAKRPRGVPHEVRKGSPNWPLIVVVATVRGQKSRIGILLTHVLREITK